MKILKQENEHGLSIFVINKRKYIGFAFAGNLDLYCFIHRDNPDAKTPYNHDNFIITKENYYLYSLFKDLFNDIENINIYPNDIDEETKQENIIRYKEYNEAHYNDLFDKEKRTITWYSDETNEKVANYLKIQEKEDSYELEFNTQPSKKGYDKDFHTNYYIPIRFRNDGSRYYPFNILFMNMYNKMCNIDDVLDEGHQIHIEEYLYNKEMSLMKK